MKNKLISIILIIFPSVIGFSSYLITSKNMDLYTTITKPPLSPPPMVFMIAWTILYILMGIAVAMYFSKRDKANITAGMISFFVQLALNFVWSIIFFNQRNFLLALVCLIALWLVVIYMTTEYLKVSRWAGILSIPYICWLSFAAYLNLAVYLMNV